MKKFISILAALLLTFVITGNTWAEGEVVHKVKKGDTLWDISARYLNTPWQWPLVWSNNQEITNPHLIYPGDMVVITKKDGKTIIKIIPADKTKEPIELYSPEAIASQKEKSIMLAPEIAGLTYSQEILQGDGKIIGIQDTGSMAAINEVLIIRSSAAIKPGQRLTTVSKIYDVLDENDMPIGYLYKTSGLVEVVSVDAEIVKGKVIYSNKEIEKSDIVLTNGAPLLPEKVQLTSPQSAEGKIVSICSDTVLGSDFDIIFINLGENQGAKTGTLLDINQILNFPEEGLSTKNYKGMALVLETLADSAMCLVVDSNDAIRTDFTVAPAR